MGKVIERLETVEKENKTLKNKLAYLEDQSRRNNIVIYGIPESNEESWADCEEKVIDNLNEKLKLEIPLDKSKIERAHRLGKKSTAQTAGVHIAGVSGYISGYIARGHCMIRSHDKHRSLVNNK